MLENIRKILIIQLRAIGDVVLTTSVLPLLPDRFPEAEIHFLTGKGIGGLLEGLRELDRVLEYPYSPGYLPGVLKYKSRIKSENYDLIIDYQGTPGTALLTRWSGARYRLGWANSSRRLAYNLVSDANTTEEYVPFQKCGMLEVLGIQGKNQTTKISFTAADLEIAKKFIAESSSDSHHLRVNISVKGKRQARHYFPDRWARLNDLLKEKYQAEVFFNRAPGEKDYVENVASLCKHPPRILPAWNLTIFAAFLSLMDVHISYDNGAKHMAIALGIPTVSLYGSANPVHWNPPRDDNHPAILPDVPCKLCSRRECGLMICMERITPEIIMEQMLTIPKLQPKLQEIF